MSKKNLIIWAFVVAVMAASVLFFPPDQRPSYFFMAGSAAAIIAASSWLMYQPRCLAYVELHPRRVRIVGWVVAGTAVAIVIGYMALAFANLLPVAGMEAVLVGATVVGLVGSMIVSFPRMAAQMKRARQAAEAAKTYPPTARAFSPLAESWRATLTILHDPARFLQISGPWAVVISASYFAMTRLPDQAKGTSGAAPWSLVLLIGAVLLLALSMPTIGVAWARWIGQGRKPDHGIALPDRAVLSVMWRLWLFNAAEATIDKPVSAKAAALAKSAGLVRPEIFGDVAGWVVEILAIVLAGVFAARLAALALGDRDFRFTDLGPVRRLGPMLGVGLVLAMAPAAIAAGLSGFLFDSVAIKHDTIAQPGLVTMTWLCVELLLLLAVFASAAAYLTRVYQTATAKP